MFETINLNALVWPKYILNPNYGIHYGRGRGPFVDAVANGFGLFVCAAACGVATRNWSRPRARSLAAVIGVLCFVGTFLTLQRSIWIGVAVGTLVTLLAVRRLRRYFIPTTLLLAIGIVGALVLIPGLAGKVQGRANQVGPIYDRKNLLTAGFNMLKTRPLTGFGWDRFQSDSLLYFQQNQNYPLTATKNGVHNFLLLYAVELGLPGLTLWALGVLLGVGGAMVSRGPPDLGPWRVALLALFLMFIVVANAVPPTLFSNLSLWLFAGVAFSGRYAMSARPTDARSHMGTAALQTVPALPPNRAAAP
jgi:O-antigen ligase